MRHRVTVLGRVLANQRLRRVEIAYLGFGISEFGVWVAVLVYARRKHFINVFVLPTKEPDTPIHPPGLRQGYQWLHWRHQGMEYFAVSDTSVADLHELEQLIYQ